MIKNCLMDYFQQQDRKLEQEILSLTACRQI